MKTPFALLFAVTAIAPACLWDGDTLAQERAKFPEIADLIAGKFPRHSKEFYQWRLKKVRAQMDKGAKKPGLYDDLAVAQHKLGDHKAAIETMLAKDKVIPGLYETYSNLGTFYIYTGELDEALTSIDRALKINPNAHFGREQYQKWLVEWVKEGKPQKSDIVANERETGFIGFSAFLAKKTNYAGKPADWKEGRAAAIKGITGMMRFADFDNPLLLEALGDVLHVGNWEENALNLAHAAYLLGSQRSKTDGEIQRLWQKQAGGIPKQRKADLKKMLAEGTEYTAKVWADERRWIAKGADVQAEFEKKYLPKAEEKPAIPQAAVAK